MPTPTRTSSASSIPSQGSATAAEAATALARGAQQKFLESEMVELPFADGGEGTLGTLLAA